MDAKQTLDKIYNDPPPPSWESCLSVYWAPLIRSMRIVGLFFNAHHYQEAKRHIHARYGSNKLVSSVAATERRSSINDYHTTSISTTESYPPRKNITTSNTSRHNTTCVVAVPPPVVTDAWHVLEEPNQSPTTSEKDLDDFVPSLLRHNSGIIDDKELADVLWNGGNTSHDNRIAGGDCNTLISSKTSSSKIRRTLKCILKCLRRGRFYAVLVTCVLWANTFRSGMTFSDNRVTLPVSSGTFLFFLKTSVNSSMLLISCWKKSHFCGFFINWFLLFADSTTRRLGLYSVSSHTNMKLMVVLVWASVAINVGFVMTILFTDYDSGGVNISLYVDCNNRLLSVIATVVLSVIHAHAWIAPVIFMVVICRHMSDTFVRFRDVLKLHIKAAGGHFPTHFRELRERHLVMCNLTTILDKYMNMALASVYGINVVSACVIMYQMVVHYMDSPMLVFYSVWLFAGLFNMFLLTHNASNVNTAMKSIMYELQTLQTSSITIEQHTQLQLFLSKLNDPDLGFTVLGVISVKKELVFTLFSLYLTYGIVLLQFRL